MSNYNREEISLKKYTYTGLTQLNLTLEELRIFIEAKKGTNPLLNVFFLGIVFSDKCVPGRFDFKCI